MIRFCVKRASSNRNFLCFPIIHFLRIKSESEVEKVLEPEDIVPRKILVSNI